MNIETIFINYASFALSTFIEGEITILHMIVEELILLFKSAEEAEKSLDLLYKNNYQTASKLLEIICRKADDKGKEYALSQIIKKVYYKEKVKALVKEELLSEDGVIIVPNKYPLASILPGVLMEMRQEWGGSPDPRINKVRGWKANSLEEVIPPCEDDNDAKAWADIQKEFFFPKEEDEWTPTTNQWGADEEEDKAEKAKEEQKKAIEEGIIKLMMDAKWYPFPASRKLILCQEEGDIVTVSPLFREWLRELLKAGVLIYGAIKSPEGYLYPESLEMDLEPNAQFPTNDFVFPAFPLTEEENDFIIVPLGDISSWWGAYLGMVTDNLSIQQLCMLVQGWAYAHNQEDYVKVYPDKATVVVKGMSEEVKFFLDKGVVVARQTRQAFPKVITNRLETSTRFTILWLILYAIQIGIGSIHGVMNSLPNMWLREVNYGHQWEDDHQTKIIRDEQFLPLGWVANENTPLGIYPVNIKFQPGLIRELASQQSFRYDLYTDKNASKLIASNGAGAASLTGIYYPPEAEDAFIRLDKGEHPIKVFKDLFKEDKYYQKLELLLQGFNPAAIVQEEFGIFCTANDGSKIGKFLNRAQQSGSWNECYAEIFFSGKHYRREKSGLLIVRFPKNEPPGIPATEDEEDSLVLAMLGLEDPYGSFIE